MKLALGLLVAALALSVAYGESTLLPQGRPILQANPSEAATPATSGPIVPEASWNPAEQSVVQPSSEEVRWVAPHNPLTIEIQELIAKFKDTPLSVSLTVIDVGR